MPNDDEKNKNGGEGGDGGTPPQDPPAPPEGDEGGDGSVSVDDPQALLSEYEKKKRENKSLRDRATAAEAELEELRKAQMSEQEKALDEARKEGYEKAEAFYKTELAKARVTSLAAGHFADPNDALMYLDLDELDLDDDKAIVKALEEVLKAKPYLSAKNGGRKSIDQGPQGGAGGEGQSASDWMRSITGRG